MPALSRNVIALCFGAMLAAFGITHPAQAASVVVPIDEFYERQTVLGFGTFVDEQFRQSHRDNFPADGRQKFYGYHAAVDVDYTGAADQDKQVAVKAITDGQVVHFGTLTGYGGLIIIRHDQPESVTSLYGHVRLSDAPVKHGDTVRAGQTIAYLGRGFSDETSGERKHLHFGIHKGPAVSVNGYEQSPETLRERWHDPNAWLTQHGAPRVTAAPALKVGQTSSPSPTAASQPAAKSQSWLAKLWHWLTGWITF